MNIAHLIFDLDNTLYPSSAAMDRGITERMMKCVAEYFHLSIEEAQKLRAEHIANFSTTLEWLRSEGLTDVEGYFKAVHPENEASELEPDPNLLPLLESIKIPKIIFTNAPSEHAERVLEKLNVRSQFEAVCDIRACGLQGKPYPQAFYKALGIAGAAIDNSLFLDDMRKYTDGFEAIGGTAVLVGFKNGKPLNRNSPAVCKTAPLHPGRTLHINSIYDLPELLQNTAYL